MYARTERLIIIISPGLHERAYWSEHGTNQIMQFRSCPQDKSYLTWHHINSTANYVALHSNSKTKSCLEPELEVDKDNGRRVGAEAKAELVQLLRVSYVAWQANASRRPTPEQQLQVYACYLYIIVDMLTHPKKITIPCQRAVQNHRRNSLLLIIRFYKYWVNRE